MIEFTLKSRTHTSKSEREKVWEGERERGNENVSFNFINFKPQITTSHILSSYLSKPLLGH